MTLQGTKQRAEGRGDVCGQNLYVSSAALQTCVKLNRISLLWLNTNNSLASAIRCDEERVGGKHHGIPVAAVGERGTCSTAPRNQSPVAQIRDLIPSLGDE